MADMDFCFHEKLKNLVCDEVDKLVVVKSNYSKTFERYGTSKKK